MVFRFCKVIFPALLLAACVREKDVVRIAVAAPLTGDISAGGQGVRRAVELAVEQSREDWKPPFRVEVVSFDDQAEPEAAAKAAGLVVSDPRIVAVIGHYTSGCSLSAAPIYARAGMPMISPSATSPRLTSAQFDPGWPGPRNVFRMVPNDRVQGPVAAEFAVRRLHKRRFAVLDDGTPYGQSAAAEFSRKLSRLGGTVVFQGALSSGERDFQALLGQIKEAGPQAVYFGGAYPEFGLLLSQARALKIECPFFAGDGARSEDLFEVAGEAAEGTYFTSPGRPLEFLHGGDSFVQAYRRRYPGAEPGPFDGFAYDAAGMLLEALRRSGPDRRQLLESLRGIRYPGLLGVTGFDRRGESTLKAVTVYRVEGRRFVPQFVP
ncbi:MAG: branched-chain amino acid ABC transporter substrate-binding protein [Elusimicrobiota bacterium]